MARRFGLAACVLVVLVGYVGTLHSLATDDVDGLNFIPNVLFGLPWNLVAGWLAWMLTENVYVEATIDMLAALVNVALLGGHLKRRRIQRPIPN